MICPKVANPFLPCLSFAEAPKPHFIQGESENFKLTRLDIFVARQSNQMNPFDGPSTPRRDPQGPIETFYTIIKDIGELMREEPMVLHVPARPDRQAQEREIQDMVATHRVRRNLIITTHFAQSEKIIWPSENLDITVTASSDIHVSCPLWTETGKQLVKRLNKA